MRSTPRRPRRESMKPVISSGDGRAPGRKTRSPPEGSGWPCRTSYHRPGRRRLRYERPHETRRLKVVTTSSRPPRRASPFGWCEKLPLSLLPRRGSAASLDSVLRDHADAPRRGHGEHLPFWGKGSAMEPGSTIGVSRLLTAPAEAES